MSSIDALLDALAGVVGELAAVDVEALEPAKRFEVLEPPGNRPPAPSCGRR